MSKSDDYDDLLKTIYWVGWIMLATPILMGLPPLLYVLITEKSFGVDGGAYATGSILTTGLVIMINTSIKMARRKSSDKTKPKQDSHSVVSST